MGQQNEFFWGDKWGVESSTAWFVSGKFNVLFSIDLTTNQFKAVAALPGGLNVFRQNSNCIKCENTIFCMPDKGECIWCYDLLTEEFQKIEIFNPTSLGIGIGDFWRNGEVVWAVSGGLKQILEIDIKKKKVVGYYSIPAQEDEKIAKSAKDGNNLYITSATRGRVFMFNIKKKEVKIQELSGVKNGLRTISVNGEKVWLSGYNREIYIWNQNKNEIKCLNNFPLSFGIYNFDRKEKPFLDCETTEYDVFAFLESIDTRDYIWFIPFQTNQILYVNKVTNEINIFEIGEEEDGKSIIDREMNCKYILQYVLDGIYIGLYSVKNSVVFEIDAHSMELKTRMPRLDIDDSTLIPRGWILKESIVAERALYEKLIKKNGEKVFEKEKIGTQIYNYMQQS